MKGDWLGRHSHQPADVPVGWWAELGLVVAECGLAVWLVAGLRPRLASGFAAVGFAGFAVYSAGRGAAGAASCGCLGDVPVNLWLMAAADAVCAVALARAAGRGQWSPPRRAVVVCDQDALGDCKKGDARLQPQSPVWRRAPKLVAANCPGQNS